MSIRPLWQTMKADNLADCRDEVNRENRLAIRLLAMVGFPLSIANMVVQMALATSPELIQFFLRTSWVTLYFLVLLVLEHWVIPEDYGHSTALLYAVETPVIICSILLGSFWDPNHQAITFFIFLMAMPVFVLDRPIRVAFVTTAWVVLFLICCYVAKSPGIFERDVLHALEFYLAAIAVANVVMRIRMIALDRLAQSQHNLEHDELTDLRNRRSLVRHIDEYLGRSTMALVSELDQLSMYNDFYGHDVGNVLIAKFASVFAEAFGADSTYRSSGAEILCVAQGGSEGEYLAIIDSCRDELRSFELEGRAIPLTCAVGYTTGTPQTADQFHQMLRLAEINAHKAGSNGKGSLIGGPFDEVKLREGIIESNIETHVRAYETNQLTGLPSMSFFIMRADEVLSTVVDEKRDPMVGLISLPCIKRFNGEFGYAQGDELIRFAAQQLHESFPNRLVCYISGSQFGVMCYRDEVESGVRMLNDSLATFKDGCEVYCKAGFARRLQGEGSIALFDKARVAERSIRDDKNVFYRLYDERLDADVKFREYIVAHLDKAIERGFLEVYYQPIICAETREICEEEALSRWNDPSYGLLLPNKFIPPLEEGRQLHKLSLHVIRRVLADFGRKREAGIEPVPVSVNLSRYDFEQCDMVEAICGIVDAAGYSRDMLRLEITESAFAEDQEFLKREVKRLRESGFRVWMDDFGSEYSTLNLLQDLDVDLIKLDMQFLRNSSNSGKNMIIVSSVLNMARQMGIDTLVEGVETEQQMQAMRAMGSGKLQGFLFSKPLPLQEIIDGIRDNGFPFQAPDF